MVLFGFTWNSLDFRDLYVYFLPQSGKVFRHFFFLFVCLFCFVFNFFFPGPFSPSWIPIMWIYSSWCCPRSPLRCHLFLKLFFILLLCLGNFHCFIFKLTNVFSASSSLLLNSSSIFFSSIITSVGTFFSFLSYHCVHLFFSQVQWTSLWLLFWTIYWIVCLSPFH